MAKLSSANLIVRLILVIGLVSLVSQPVFGQSIDELRKKRETIGRDIERKKQELEKKKQEEAKLNQQIQKLDTDMAVTQNRISQTAQKITDVQQKIDELSREIIEKETDLTTEQEHKKEAIQTLYEATEQNPIILIMGLQGISEAVDRASYLEALESKIEATIKKITDLKNQLEEQRHLAQKQQQEFEQLKRQQEIYHQGLESQKKQRSTLLVETKKAQKTLAELVEEAKKAYADVNSELHRIQEMARKKGRAAGVKRTGSLGIGWPISGEITTRFGEPTFVQSFHTGLDIDCIVGDSIAALAAGKVSFVGGDRSYGYGLYVKVDHGDGITSLYAHLTNFEVTAGDEIKLGQVVGYCGNTGYARAFHPGGDGSHLHLEVREDDIPANPYIYLP